nr:Chain B, Myocyte-specific enhancer factor 2A [Homo sapiens]
RKPDLRVVIPPS